MYTFAVNAESILLLHGGMPCLTQINTGVANAKQQNGSMASCLHHGQWEAQPCRHPLSKAPGTHAAPW